MKSLRVSTAETNSSSVHVLTLGKSYPRKDKNLYFYPGEFGWEVEQYDTPAYFWTLICVEYKDNNRESELPKVAESIEKALNSLGDFKVTCEFEYPDSYNYFWVDHMNNFNIVCDTIDMDTNEVKDPELLGRLLLSDDSAVYTGNDNDGPMPGEDDYPYSYDEDLVY